MEFALLGVARAVETACLGQNARSLRACHPIWLRHPVPAQNLDENPVVNPSAESSSGKGSELIKTLARTDVCSFTNSRYQNAPHQIVAHTPDRTYRF